MNRELVRRTIEIFDSPEKWNDFLELVSAKGEITNEWLSCLDRKLGGSFLVDNVQGWSYKRYGLIEARWFLTELGENSIRLELFGNMGFGIRGDWNPPYDQKKALRLLKTEPFNQLLRGFQGNIQWDNYGAIVFETGAFQLNSPHDWHFDAEHIAWFAGKRTDMVFDQIAKKVNYFRTTEMTELLRQLNKESRA